MATHSSILAWRIPGTGEPGGLPSMGLHRVGHDWSDLAIAANNGMIPKYERSCSSGICYLLYNASKQNLPNLDFIRNLSSNLRLFTFNRSHFDLSEPTVLHCTHESPLLQDTACSRSCELSQQTIITLFSDLQHVPQATAQHATSGHGGWKAMNKN